MKGRKSSRKPLTVFPGSASYDIQNLVRRLLSFRDLEEWQDYLEESGASHTHYYHYTTMGALQSILKQGRWKLKFAPASNDNTEAKVHAASFTTSFLSSMGMWSQYSHWPPEHGLDGTTGIGVRIGIPAAVFKQIFGKATQLLADSGKKPGQSVPFGKPCDIHVTDVAYWYFGANPDATSDMLYYRSFEFPFNALGIYDDDTAEKRFSKVAWRRPDPEKPLPPCFKRSIWRSEREVRAYCTLPPNAPAEVFVPITRKQFGEMTIYLAPHIYRDGDGRFCYKQPILLQDWETLNASFRQITTIPPTETWIKGE